MIPRDCKRLAEVDFPIAQVSIHAAREKSIRYGHPSTLHLWWARRPLASSRAMLLALLLPDPCDPLCPDQFKAQARPLVAQLSGCNPGDTDKGLRGALLHFIGSYADWELSANRTYTDVARGLITAAHGDEVPLVADPFAGGGSIPLEALRLGCEVFASDLNPVSVLIQKVLLQDIPRRAVELSDEIGRVRDQIRSRVSAALEELYPRDPDGAIPIAYLWARTVRCEAPQCGAEIPIYKSPWLSRRGSTRARYFRESPTGRCAALIVDSNRPGGPATFRIAIGDGSEDPRAGFIRLSGTKVPGNNANVVCLCCGTVLPGNRTNPRTRDQLAAQKGCSDVLLAEDGTRIGGARLLAVVTIRPGQAGRSFRLPRDADYKVIQKAELRLAEITQQWANGDAAVPKPVPDEPLPFMSGTFNVPIYGMNSWGDLFTTRQKVALATLAAEIQAVPDDDAAKEVAGLALSRLTDIYNALARWENTKTQVRNLFTRQAIPMVWDFAEASVVAGQAGDYFTTLETMQRVINRFSALGRSADVEPADAAESPLPDEAVSVWFTDPPYYFAVPYADLSDFFFVWLKRVLPNHPLLRDRFDPGNPLTPKERELCEMAHWDPKRYAIKDNVFFEDGMRRAFAEGRRVLREDGIGAVVFAHKTTEGWEALLSGMIRGGWTITASWPVATELATRLRARRSAALATSVHLVCRPRPSDAPVGDWSTVLRELPIRVGDWMERLQDEGVRGADLVFACIGPALEIFSRFSKVEMADGREVGLPGYLEKVWEVVGRSALGQVLGTAEARARNGASGAVEEDARLTALFLWTLQSTDTAAAPVPRGEQEDVTELIDDEDDDESAEVTSRPKGFTLVYDVVRRFAQPLGIDLPQWEGRIIETKQGVVRMLPVVERARQLFGEDGAETVAARLEQQVSAGGNPLQGVLFPDLDREPIRGSSRRGRSRRTDIEVRDGSLTEHDATTLDRVHAAILLQRGGRTNALRALLKSEQERGSDFLRLANSLSALYPKDSEEKRLLDAMLLAAPR